MWVRHCFLGATNKVTGVGSESVIQILSMHLGSMSKYVTSTAARNMEYVTQMRKRSERHRHHEGRRRDMGHSSLHPQ